MDNWLKKAFRKQAENEWMTQHPVTGKLVWQTHIDTFWQKFLEYMPELGGSEFDTGDNDFAAMEGNRFIFEHWLREVPDELKVLGDLKPEFKQQVRSYLMETKNFDPFEGDGGLPGQEDELPPDEGDEVDPLSADDLESWFGEDAVEPGAPGERHPEIAPPSADDLENMFSDEVYDPGAPEERRRRNSGGEWWQ